MTGNTLDMCVMRLQGSVLAPCATIMFRCSRHAVDFENLLPLWKGSVISHQWDVAVCCCTQGKPLSLHSSPLGQNGCTQGKVIKILSDATLSLSGKQEKQKEGETQKMTVHAPKLSVFKRHLDNALNNAH